MNKNKKWLLLISIPAIISFLIILFFSISEMPEPGIPGRQPMMWYRPFIVGLRGSQPVPVHTLIIPSILLMIAIIPISYYFISRRLEEKLKENMKVVSKLISKKYAVSETNLKNDTDKNIILKFLNQSERKIIEKLITEKGRALQSEISRMKGMTKLRTHRAVKDLERKDIIIIEKYGKTNRITLSKDIKDILLK